MRGKAKYSKKGQIGLIEMIMVIFIVTVLIVVGIVFYTGVLKQSIQKKGGEILSQKAEVELRAIQGMPEIECSKNVRREDCIDTLKLLIAKEVIDGEEKGYYATIFGRKRVLVKQVYPELQGQVENQECTQEKYNQEVYPNNCDTWIIYESRPATITEVNKISVPVSLYFPNAAEDRKNEYRIGELIIESYR